MFVIKLLAILISTAALGVLEVYFAESPFYLIAGKILSFIAVGAIFIFAFHHCIEKMSPYLFGFDDGSAENEANKAKPNIIIRTGRLVETFLFAAIFVTGLMGALLSDEAFVMLPFITIIRLMIVIAIVFTFKKICRLCMGIGSETTSYPSKL